MNLRKKSKEGIEVSTESLNDIMFFLLLFFLILSTLATNSFIQVNLPSSKDNVTIPTKQVSIYMTKERKYYVEKREVSYNNLEDELKKEFAGVGEKTLSLSFDNSLAIQDLVDVMQIGAKLKLKMVIATKPANA